MMFEHILEMVHPFVTPERPGHFSNFKNVVDTGRVKVPFGIAQIGKAFRNEITPRNFIFRSKNLSNGDRIFYSILVRISGQNIILSGLKLVRIGFLRSD